MTESLVTMFQTWPPPAHVTLSFFTGPQNAPNLSMTRKDVMPRQGSAYHSCFLVFMRKNTMAISLLATASTRSLGFSARHLKASPHNSVDKFGIITTGQVWETLLTNALANFLGARDSTRFAGAEVYRKIGQAAKVLVQDRGASAICLGCAGMVGMEEAITQALGEKLAEKVLIVDGVKAGVLLLNFNSPKIIVVPDGPKRRGDIAEASVLTGAWMRRAMPTRVN
ncbi:Hydantoin racemase [Rhizoctonia solani]|uniref:Hydantoin racemase n=1 Tax=Rhizoctonia solani TaxID=456999 RepID=A0A8H7IHA7_9AGAM|nr:Hydantoin racemase [Rhizoctonia solani]